MTLSDNDKQEIIQYVNDNLDGESTCDDEGDDMIIFTFDREQDEQPLVGTETILEILNPFEGVIEVKVNVPVRKVIVDHDCKFMFTSSQDLIKTAGRLLPFCVPRTLGKWRKWLRLVRSIP